MAKIVFGATGATIFAIGRLTALGDIDKDRLPM